MADHLWLPGRGHLAGGTLFCSENVEPTDHDAHWAHLCAGDQLAGLPMGRSIHQLRALSGRHLRLPGDRTRQGIPQITARKSRATKTGAGTPPGSVQVILLQRHGQSVVRNKRDRPARRIASLLRLGSLAPGNLARKPLWFIKSKRRRVFDAGGASLDSSALYGVVFEPL